MTGTSWKDAPLVALDLEGSGAQERDDEDIPEIALVPIAGGLPAIASAYTTVINPGRPIPAGPGSPPASPATSSPQRPTSSTLPPNSQHAWKGKSSSGTT
jgi:DNA polymerase III subunit epsilon